MGIFGDDKAEEIEALQQQIRNGDLKLKKLAQELAAERKGTESLRLELAKAVAELAGAKRAVQKARQRQRASVERANRFKARLDTVSSPVQGS